MNFEATLAFAESLDEADPLKDFRNQFWIPLHNGKDAIYLCGNSLGLQPRTTEQYIGKQLTKWRELAVEGWFQGEEPWLEYHRQLSEPLSQILGARKSEVTIMNSLTVNLHLLLVSFYKPTSKRYKIIMEGNAFPSDQYAMESQVRLKGFEPSEAVIEVFPRDGEYTLQTEDILSKIEEHQDELALILFGGVNYYTGQFFDIKAITEAAHQAGAYAGFDLAHAAGNVLLSLHDWQVDFACWCSYKYLNSGPGGISGAFVHEKHHSSNLNRFAGWWGYRNDTRFKMAPGFDAEVGAEGWQVSTSPVLLLAAHHAALDVFMQAGGIYVPRDKAKKLTSYLEFLINKVNQTANRELFRIITPVNEEERGCQLSIICDNNGKQIFDHLVSQGIIGDWREPDVIRLSPVPLYNQFKDLYETFRVLNELVEGLK